jgi:hypothetical protein
MTKIYYTLLAGSDPDSTTARVHDLKNSDTAR